MMKRIFASDPLGWMAVGVSALILVVLVVLL